MFPDDDHGALAVPVAGRRRLWGVAVARARGSLPDSSAHQVRSVQASQPQPSRPIATSRGTKLKSAVATVDERDDRTERRAMYIGVGALLLIILVVVFLL